LLENDDGDVFLAIIHDNDPRAQFLEILLIFKIFGMESYI
jgi:hypothetical protein